MGKPVFYVAHPVSGDPVANAYKTIAWVKWLTLNDTDRIYIAPWVAEVLAFANDIVDPAFYDRVLSDDEEVVKHLDGLLMVGGTISTGMRREMLAAFDAKVPVINWVQYRSPDEVPAGVTPRVTGHV